MLEEGLWWNMSGVKTALGAPVTTRGQRRTPDSHSPSVSLLFWSLSFSYFQSISVSLSLCLFVSFFPSFKLSVSVSLSFYLRLFRSVSISLILPVFLSVSPSVSLSLSPLSLTLSLLPPSHYCTVNSHLLSHPCMSCGLLLKATQLYGGGVNWQDQLCAVKEMFTVPRRSF